MRAYWGPESPQPPTLPRVVAVLVYALLLWNAYAAWYRGNILDTVLVWGFVAALCWAARK